MTNEQINKIDSLIFSIQEILDGMRVFVGLDLTETERAYIEFSKQVVKDKLQELAKLEEDL